MKRDLAKGLGPILLLSAALALPAAATAQPGRYGYRAPYAGRPYSQTGIDGFISSEGGRCPSIRDHRSGRTYPLTGVTRELRPGDHVVLNARPVAGSTCGAGGSALQVLEIRTVWTDDGHGSAYFDARRDGSFGRFILSNRDRGGWYSDRYAYLRQGRTTPRGGPYGQDAGRYDRSRPYHDGQNGQGQYNRGPEPNAPNAPNAAPYDDGYAPNGQDDSNGQYDNYDNGGTPDDQYAPNAPNGSYDDRADRSGDNRQLITVDGTLDYNGACPAVRDGNGTSYDLAGQLGNHHDGDRVRVLGFAAGRSSCGGTALEVQEIRKR
jgi:hypothetical protein